MSYATAPTRHRHPLKKHRKIGHDIEVKFFEVMRFYKGNWPSTITDIKKSYNELDRHYGLDVIVEFLAQGVKGKVYFDIKSTEHGVEHATQKNKRFLLVKPSDPPDKIFQQAVTIFRLAIEETVSAHLRWKDGVLSNA